MMDFLIFSGQIWKKSVINLQALRLKLKRLDQTFISSKSKIQLTKTIFSDSDIFIEKKTLENRLWAKSELLWAIFSIHVFVLGCSRIHFSPRRRLRCICCYFSLSLQAYDKSWLLLAAGAEGRGQEGLRARDQGETVLSDSLKDWKRGWADSEG